MLMQKENIMLHIDMDAKRFALNVKADSILIEHTYALLYQAIVLLLIQMENVQIVPQDIK
jgi:hypothetical protein